jgi:primosomal protein N' (replication factor Y) (superfamily II helicase)
MKFRALNSFVSEVFMIVPAGQLVLSRGRQRSSLIFLASLKAGIQGFLRQMVREAPRPKGSLMVQLDVDPQSFV